MTSEIVSREPDYCYALMGCPNDFVVGTTKDGMQVLVVFNYPRFIALFFDRDGNLIKQEEHLLSATTRQIAQQYGLDEALSRNSDQELARWLETIGYNPGIVKIKKFFLPDYHLGISDFPPFLQAILRNPANYTEDEVLAARAELPKWKEEGLFELWLNPGTSRWINRFGEVEA